MIGSILAVVRNSTATILIRGSFGLARVFMLLIIARSFGAEQFGMLSIVLSLVEILRILGDMGIDTVSIRRFASPDQDPGQVLNSVLGSKLLFGSAVVALAPVIYVSVYGRTDGLAILVIASFSILTSLVLNAFISFFQARLAMGRIIAANLSGVGVYVILTAVLLASGAPLWLVVAAIPAGELTTLILVRKVYSVDSAPRVEFRRSIVRSLLTDGVYVGISGVMVATYIRLDTLMLGRMAGPVPTGRYAVAYRLLEPFLLVFTSLSISFYALLAKTWGTSDPRAIGRVIRSILVPATVLSLFSAALLALFAGPLVRMISDEYLVSAGVLRVLACALVFKALNPQLTAILNSLGKYRILMVIVLFNLLLSVGLNLILIPAYGITGAAFTVVAVEGINLIMQATIVRRTWKLSYGTRSFSGI